MATSDPKGLREAVAHELMLAENDCQMDWPSEKVSKQLAAITKPHAGDCPFVEIPAPITCMRCVAENVYMRTDRLIALLASQPKEEGWRPIESAPIREPGLLIGQWEDGVFTNVYQGYRDETGRIWGGWPQLRIGPSYWRPLPAAPLPIGEGENRCGSGAEERPARGSLTDCKTSGGAE